MLFDKTLRRHEEPWEVVDIRDVSPVPVQDEGEEMDIIRVHNTNITYKFIHDLQNADEVRKAVQYARARLMQDAILLNYNVLLSEGWHCTLLRKGRRHRVEVVYSGRPARALGKVIHLSQPPFMGVLDHCEYHFKNHRVPPRRKLFHSFSLASMRRAQSCISSA